MPGLELPERTYPPAHRHPPAYDADANGIQLSTDRPIELLPLESDPTESRVYDAPPPTIVVTAISVDRRAVMIVIASFLLTFTGCGLNFAFGVYQELYETPAGPFHGNVSPSQDRPHRHPRRITNDHRRPVRVSVDQDLQSASGHSCWG